MVAGKDSSSESSISPLSPTLDLPPSYDDISQPGSSSAGGSSQPYAQPPKETLHLFSGPSNAEPLLGRAETPLEVLNDIQTTRVPGGWIASHDYRLQNRESTFPSLDLFFWAR